MCLIIAPTKDGTIRALLPRDAFDYAYARNQDGFGAMWTEDGRVNHFKALGMEADQMYDYMQEYVERFPDVIFHLRLKTHGRITPSLCHPFRILHKNRHGKDLFFMHNGVLSSFGNRLTYGQSDTTAFKDKVLIPLLTRNPDALDDPAVMASIDKLTSGSRLIFMDSDGKVWRTSDYSWNEKWGPICSNNYMLPNRPLISEQSYPSEGNVVMIGGAGGPKEKNGLMYNIFRRIDKDNHIKSYWCAQVANGYIRTETGLLYKDRGTNVILKHEIDFIKKEDEFSLMVGWEAEKDVVDDSDRYAKYMEDAYKAADAGEEFLDDGLPWDEDTLAKHTAQYSSYGDEDEQETVGSAVANLDSRLRYARLVHNTQGSGVESREQLIADLIGMAEEEMGSFIKEDPETSHVVMSELIEIICEQNDWIAQTPELKDLAFQTDEIIELGSLSHHQDSMKKISALRKARYQRMLAAKREAEEKAAAAKEAAKEKVVKRVAKKKLSKAG